MSRKMVRNFAEKEIAPIAQEMDDKKEFSYTLTRRMGELEPFGPFVSEEYNGSNVSYISYIIKGQLVPRVLATKLLNSMIIKDFLGRGEIAFA